MGGHLASGGVQAGVGSLTERSVRVLPDVSGLDAEFDYSIDAGVDVQIGSIVRVDLHGRRVRGWVTQVDSSPPDGVKLQPVRRVSSLGPSHELIELAAWAANRWTGARSHYLTTASPPRNVRALPRRTQRESEETAAPSWALQPASVARLGPSTDPMTLLEPAHAWGNLLVITPSLKSAERLARRLHGVAGRAAVAYPERWDAAAAGGVTVVGTRIAAWATLEDIDAIVVVDSHDDAHYSEASPTWNAIDVVAERARRRNIPLLLLSPVPRVTDLHGRVAIEPDRQQERRSWAPIHVVDVRNSDPRRGLYSAPLVDALRSDKRVVCVLNRKGRAQLLVCSRCDTVATCERCEGPEVSGDAGLRCRRCETQRPEVCSSCGAGRFKQLRQGISKVREEMEALARRPVGEVSAETAALPQAAVLVGTEAVLHRVGRADVVAFLEIDQELLASRYRAEEDALILLARASRVVRGHDGLVIAQTRIPQNDVLQAALKADPAGFAAQEDVRRKELGWPPYSVFARLSGSRAAEAAAALPNEVLAFGPDGAGRWMLRAPSHDVLVESMKPFKRKRGELRLEIDPARA